MAVIKIVPMPGAVGDKGDEGAPGAQGPQGPAGQNGLPGTPALWSYQGAYNPSAAYAVGDVVVYQGQLYYTKSVTTAGTLPTNTTKFDLIAAKGADGTNGTNGTNGADGAPGATPFTLIGEYDNGASYNLGIAVYYNGGTYVRTGNPLNPGYPPILGAINESWTPIAEKGADSIAPTSGTWDSEFLSLSQITAPNYSEIATYYTIGDLVYFNFVGNIGIITSTTDHLEWLTTNADTYTTSSQFRLKLPFTTLSPVYFVGNMFDNSYDTDNTLRPAVGRYAVFGRTSNSDILHLEVSSPILLAREGEPGIMVGEIFPLSAKFPFDMTEPISGNGNYVRISGVYQKA